MEPVISRLQSIPIAPHSNDDGDGNGSDIPDAAREGKQNGDLTGPGYGSARGAKRKRDDVFAFSPHAGPNHCLVNEYTPGQGIHPHEDGDAYFPVVCTVSLGSHTVLDVKRKAEPHSRDAAHGWRILQEPRSLLITRGEMYTDCLHGIAEVEVDVGLNGEEIANWCLLGDKADYAEGWKRRETRVSLTYRDVVRVKKVGKAFGGLIR